MEMKDDTDRIARQHEFIPRPSPTRTQRQGESIAFLCAHKRKRNDTRQITQKDTLGIDMECTFTKYENAV